MPANRSRTLEWRRCLHQIRDRNGAIEIAIARTYHDDRERRARDLVWRVRILDVTDSEIVVEQPMALGQTIPVENGLELVGVLSIGQNRWTFNTANLGSIDHRMNESHSIPALRLLMPESVQRCQRRNYYRVSTALLMLPDVEIWPLIDPASVVLAERANELQFTGTGDVASEMEAVSTDVLTEHPESWQLPDDHEDVMPEVGPGFTATLLNIGGGGIGLLIEPDDAQVISRHKLFWLRISLPPHLDVPICATGKLVHSHMESSHQVYAGLAFDFSFNPSHQRFVVDQICRYIAVQQREQLQRRQQQEADAEAPDRRKSA